MAGVNKVILIGNVGKNPEIKTFENGMKVANFSLATTETYKNKDGERVAQTEWHNIVIFRKLAEVVEKYVTKGDSLYIEGSLKTRSWEKDGEKKYITEVVANNMTMLGGKPKQPQPEDYKEPDKQFENNEPESDDLPF